MVVMRLFGNFDAVSGRLRRGYWHYLVVMRLCAAIYAEKLTNLNDEKSVCVICERFNHQLCGGYL